MQELAGATNRCPRLLAASGTRPGALQTCGANVQVAAGTVYYEYQRGVLASEEKKQQERLERQRWEQVAEQQRQVP